MDEGGIGFREGHDQAGEDHQEGGQDQEEEEQGRLLQKMIVFYKNISILSMKLFY